MSFQPGKNAKILVDQYDLSAYLNDVSETATVDTPDTTTFGATAKAKIGALKEGTIALKGFYDSSAGATDAVLRAALTSTAHVITVEPAGGAVGNPARLSSDLEGNYQSQAPVAGVVNVSAEFRTSVDNGIDYGVSLKALAAEVASTNQASVDNTGSSANGGVAHLHCTAVAGDGTETNTVKIQHAPDNLTWADLVTFTGLAAAATSERKTVAAGTAVNRYLRAISTIAFGGASVSYTCAVSFARR